MRLSVALRTRRLGNDFFYALIPPHWHHTPAELSGMVGVPLPRWFDFGYSAWRFTESGEERVLDGSEDPRWDPRCMP